MQDIITQTFDTWAVGLTPLQMRIKIFEEVRDIPYYLIAQIEPASEWAVSILRTRKASCSPKHYLIGILFGRLGIPVKYATYPFRWEKQPIKYNDELLPLAKGCPTGYHAACKVCFNGRWVLVDATWDSALEQKAGFAVNAHWDGYGDTRNAVVPLEEIIHNSLQERLDYVKQKKSAFSRQETETYARFSAKFNSWLEDLRREQMAGS